MSWVLTEVSDVNPLEISFTDSEVTALYETVRDRIKGPYDDSNPAFTAYLKLVGCVKTAS